MRRSAAALAVLGILLVAAGCGLGPGEGTSGASILVTRDFGARQVGMASARQVPGGETVMRALQRRFEVRTRYGGKFVDAIAGIRGGASDGRRVDWFFYVNGIEASEGAASVKLHRGDRIWWDNHDWQGAMRIPAVVGSFPEPFRSGAGGRRIPVRLDCASAAAPACDAASRSLEAIGVKLAKGSLTSGTGPEMLRVVVGTWPQVRIDRAARLVELGPRRSGVFARFDAAGSRLELLDARLRVARTLRAGAGLVAAARYEDQQPTWLVTGTDTAGVLAAARSLTPGRLSGHFAVALDGATPVPVPTR